MRKNINNLSGVILACAFTFTSSARAVSDKIIDSHKEQRAKYFLTLGNQYSERGLKDKATEYWKIALALDSELTEAREKLEPSSKSKSSDVPRTVTNEKIEPALPSERYSDFLVRAQTAYDKKNYIEALKYLDAADSLSPRRPETATFRAKITLEDFESDLDRPYNDLVKNFFQESVEHYRRKHYEQALASIEQAQKLDPGHPQVENLKVRIQADYSDVLAGKEIQRAKDQWKDGNGEIALEILKNILEKNPNSSAARDLQNQILDSLKKEKPTHTWESTQPSHSKEKNRLSNPLKNKIKDLVKALETGDKEKAGQYLKEITELSPDNPKLEYWNEKIKELSGNEPSNDSSAKADEVYNLGLESYRKGDLVNAKKFWSETLELDPRHIQAKRNLDRLLDEHPDLK